MRLFRPAIIAMSIIAAVVAPGLTAAWAATRSVAEIANLSGPDRQQILEAGARQEKEVMFYTSLIVDQVVRPLADGFEKKYPFLKVVYLRNNSTQLVQRILAEGKARAVQADVVAASVGSIRVLCGDRYVVVPEFRCNVGAVRPDQRVKLWMNLELSEGYRVS